MSVYCFGSGYGTVSKSRAFKLDLVASKFGCSFRSPCMPDGPRYWFEGPNRGEPFDKELASKVIAEVTRLGLLPRKYI